MNDSAWQRLSGSDRWRRAGPLRRALAAAAVGLCCLGAYLGNLDRLPKHIDADQLHRHQAGQSLILEPVYLAPPVRGWGEVLLRREPDTLPHDPFYPMVLLGLVPALALAALIALAVVARHRVGLPLTVLALLGWLTAGMWPVVMLVAYDIGARERQAPRLRWAAVIGVAVTGLPMLATGGPRWGVGEAMVAVVLAAAVLVALPMLLGLWLSTRNRLLGELRERVERAESEQQARADQARLEERARITREMHDVVAHRVSLMVLHAGGVEVSSTDERSARSAALIRSTGREALTELRDMLSVLSRPPGLDGAPTAPVPSLADLDRLLEQSRAAGIRVTRHDDGQLDDLPASVGRTAYRVVREGLTNVARHAGSTDVQVALRREPTALLVKVHNGPPVRPPAPPPASGYGLVGLRERVGLLGGTLSAGPATAGGFTLQALLPLTQPAPADGGTR